MAFYSLANTFSRTSRTSRPKQSVLRQLTLVDREFYNKQDCVVERVTSCPFYDVFEGLARLGEHVLEAKVSLTRVSKTGYDGDINVTPQEMKEFFEMTTESRTAWFFDRIAHLTLKAPYYLHSSADLKAEEGYEIFGKVTRFLEDREGDSDIIQGGDAFVYSCCRLHIPLYRYVPGKNDQQWSENEEAISYYSRSVAVPPPMVNGELPRCAFLYKRVDTGTTVAKGSTTLKVHSKQ